MKKTGIWIDKNEAVIVSLEKGKEATVIIPSNIEHFNVRGGSGTRLKGGPQDVVQDSKYLEREKHQFRNYFSEVVSHIADANAIAIFGPAGTNDKLKKELEQSYKEVNQKVVAVIKADSMTENQIRALIRDYFDSNV
jgi:stalled ribosome rescue protein Dom34